MTLNNAEPIDAGDDVWTPKLSKKEQKKREKAARAEQLAKEEELVVARGQQDEFVDAEEEWNDTPSGKKSPRSPRNPFPLGRIPL